MARPSHKAALIVGGSPSVRVLAGCFCLKSAVEIVARPRLGGVGRIRKDCPPASLIGISTSYALAALLPRSRHTSRVTADQSAGTVSSGMTFALGVPWHSVPLRFAGKVENVRLHLIRGPHHICQRSATPSCASARACARLQLVRDAQPYRQPNASLGKHCLVKSMFSCASRGVPRSLQSARQRRAAYQFCGHSGVPGVLLKLMASAPLAFVPVHA